MGEFKVNDHVILLRDMPFGIKKGDECIITNITASISPYKLLYHIRKNKTDRYEFRVENNEIKKK